MKLQELNRFQRTLAIGTAFLVICLLLLLLAEGAVRVRSYLRSGFWWGVEETYVVDESTGLRVPRPHLRAGPIVINSRGFRGPEIEVTKDARTIRLAFLGGSTTYCAEVSSNAMTWPHLVTEDLRSAFPNATFDYINAAVPGYAVESSRKNLTLRVAAYEPDIVVIYHATNDLSFNSFQAAVESGVATQRADEQKFWLSKYSLLSHLIELNLKILLLQQQKTVGAQGKLEARPKELAEPFAEDLRELVRTAQALSPVVAVATFSVQYRRGQSPEEQLRAAGTSLYYMPYMSVSTLLDSFDAYNEAIRDIAVEESVILIGREDHIPGDPGHFKDSVHFTDQGSVAMADRVTSALLESTAVQRLIQSRASRLSPARGPDERREATASSGSN